MSENHYFRIVLIMAGSLCSRLKRLYLYPGQLVVTKDAMEITTILGSCVSVCFFDPIRRIAGMNHFLLPVYDNYTSDIEKYGDTSLDFMLDKMLHMGSNQRDIVAKVFGGGRSSLPTRIQILILERKTSKQHWILFVNTK